MGFNLVDIDDGFCQCASGFSNLVAHDFGDFDAFVGFIITGMTKYLFYLDDNIS